MARPPPSAPIAAPVARPSGSAAGTAASTTAAPRTASTTQPPIRADDAQVRVVAGRGASRLLEPTLAALDGLDVDSVVCGLCSDVRPLGGLLGMVDWRLCGRLSRMLEQGVVTGADGEKILFATLGRIGAPRLFVYGWGPLASSHQRAAERVTAMAAMVKDAGAVKVAFAFPEPARALLEVGASQVERELGERLQALFGADPVPPV